MLTAGITMGIAAILGAFGIKPGRYLFVVAGAVKLSLIGVGIVIGMRAARRRKAKDTSGNAPESGDAPGAKGS